MGRGSRVTVRAGRPRPPFQSSLWLLLTVSLLAKRKTTGHIILSVLSSFLLFFFFFFDGGITQLPHHDFWRLPHTLCVELTSLPKWGELRGRQAGQGSGCFAGWGQTGQERKLSFGSSLQENKYQIRERRRLGLRSELSPRRPAGGKRASLRVFTPGTCDGKRQAKGRRVNEASGIIRRSRVTVGSKGCFFQDFIFLAFYVLVTDKKILESHGYFKKKIAASYFIGD